MSFIQTRRETVIRDNNHAQTEFESILSQLKKDTIEINIQTELHGDLDLSVLSEQEYTRVSTIRIGKGELTSIRNIPSSVLKFTCTENLLVEMSDLPISTVYLDLTHNFLTFFDFAKIPNIEEFRCGDNKIKRFDNLSKAKKLIVFVCDQNKLEHIDLKGLDKLKTLNVSNNPVIVVENVPDTIHEFVSENNHAEIITTHDSDSDSDSGTKKRKKDKKGEDIAKKINFIDAINAYFKLKTKYEEKMLQNKKQAFLSAKSTKMGMRQAAKVKPGCIHCRRPVGTIFSNKANMYSAICGDTKQPCNLKIKIFRGEHSLNEYYVYLFRQQLEDDKQTLIVQKMDTLFNYISEKQTSEKFKKNIQEHIETSEIYTERLNTHNEIYNNPQRTEKIQKKMETVYSIQEKIAKLIEEYKDTKNTEILETAMNIYVHDLKPEIENARRLKYAIMEIDDDVLYQNIAGLSEIESRWGEPPSVLQFTKV